MNDRHETNEATTSPVGAEVAMMLIIMAMLMINLVATIYVASYEPVCMPAVMEDVE
jgi:hypothetical protein